MAARCWASASSQTTLFNAYNMVGVIAGLLLGGALLIPRIGKKRMTAAGNLIGVLAFALLAVLALRRESRGRCRSPSC